MPQFLFHQINVFSQQHCAGNPVAVIHDADALSPSDMQRIARWLNLSETVFIVQPTNQQADYGTRIFNVLGQEVSFSGHPALGACHAWVQAGGTPKIPSKVVQECPNGLVTMQQTKDNYWQFAAANIQNTDISASDLAIIHKALNLEDQQLIASQVLDNGHKYHTLLLDSANTVLSIIPDLGALAEAKLNVGIIGPYPQNPLTQDDAPSFEVRFFAPASGIEEDPVTGSFNGAAAKWLIATQQASSNYIVSQGIALGRKGRVFIEQDSQKQVWVGGYTQTCISAQLEL